MMTVYGEEGAKSIQMHVVVSCSRINQSIKTKKGAVCRKNSDCRKK